ncbi:uncharacterized protein AB675_1970 [Cyphellophora attinorum]|uniref:Uncharacterized protein n=1 Tax=Cyphellophora attinorum TaxID=1664694 RepID=A0A0N0NPS5_9EURO|nr:uncharacterized protein AB675_1970 [Phialophora attinorum]KPI43068.1 hypothetical protein AB675_1970 [Phialophora attinorum]
MASSSPLFESPLASKRPPMSITLPRNFAPTDLSDPKTPDQTFAEVRLPPAPHFTTMKVRRRPIDMTSFTAQNSALPPALFASEIPVPSSAMPQQQPFQLSSDPFDPDTPVPSVEPEPMTSVTRPPFQHSITDPFPSDRLQLPAYREQPPRTPPAQTNNTPAQHKLSVWDMPRSTSECSLRSDSSVSSSGETFNTRPTSFDGSATSPDTELDPFSPGKIFLVPDTPTRRGKKIKLKSAGCKEKVDWSIEMDNHLFNVYQMYLADPALTPFKTLPGSIPPTGVCHRVARRAKETWPRAKRIAHPIVTPYKVRSVLDARGLPLSKTPEPEDFLHNGSSKDSREPWPSESATRRRLKQLCKEKFTISAHYQRLRESRSPSPFTEQFQRRPPSRLTRSKSHPMAEDASAYATRELGISLVASGATAPLAQLVTGDSPMMDQSEDFFNTPLLQPNQPAEMPQTGLGIQEEEPGKLSVGGNIPRLASPFAYSTWNGSSKPSNPHRRRISQNQFDTIHATGSRLLSPFKPEPDVSSNVNKRRALHNLEDELSPRGSSLGPELAPQPEPSNTPHELVFTGAGDISQRRIRLRGRGATLGALNARDRIQSLFDPPTPSPTAVGIPPVPALPASLTALATASGTSNTAVASSSRLALPEQDASQKRLGSPFELDPNKRSQRQMVPRHVPSLSDPFISTHGQSLNERLAEMDSWHRMDYQRQNRRRPSDAFEWKLLGAEGVPRAAPRQ